VCKVRILVAEDIELWRHYISSVLREEPSFEIICEVVDGLRAVQVAEQQQPTIALLDIGLPRLAGIDAARSIKELSPNTAVVFLSGEQDLEVIQAALDVGSGYVLKSDAASDLIAAIKAVARGDTFTSRQLAGVRITSRKTV
jgi:Response regulator containing a CheY-like receiver domain and an HTH DNA-binding domain